MLWRTSSTPRSTARRRSVIDHGGPYDPFLCCPSGVVALRQASPLAVCAGALVRAHLPNNVGKPPRTRTRQADGVLNDDCPAPCRRIGARGSCGRPGWRSGCWGRTQLCCLPSSFRATGSATVPVRKHGAGEAGLWLDRKARGRSGLHAIVGAADARRDVLRSQRAHSGRCGRQSQCWARRERFFPFMMCG